MGTQLNMADSVKKKVADTLNNGNINILDILMHNERYY